MLLTFTVIVPTNTDYELYAYLSTYFKISRRNHVKSNQ